MQFSCIMTDLSIIIVNWNTRELLRRCLASIYRHSAGLEFAVWVVDNASTDGSAEMAAREFPQARLIRNQENVGFSRANNQALRQAEGRYLLLLNSDTVLQENALRQMVAFMDAHPTVGIAGSRLLNADGTWQPSCDLFPRKPFAMLRDKLADALFPGTPVKWEDRMRQWNARDNFPVDYVIGAVLMIRRETFAQIGGLDERFFMYAEDIDWCYRAARAGWATHYVGTAAIVHLNRGSSEPTPQQAERLRRLRDQSLLAWYGKHYGRLNAWLMRLVFLLKRRKFLG